MTILVSPLSSRMNQSCFISVANNGVLQEASECEVHGSKGIVQVRIAMLFSQMRHGAIEVPLMTCTRLSTMSSLPQSERTTLSMTDRAANSTLLAILGRTVAYTGQTISWENAKLEGGLESAHYDFDKPLPVAPIATPGVTKFV